MAGKDRTQPGQVRCLNCLSRFRPLRNKNQAVCESCGLEWRISWVNPDFPKIRGPVWASYPNMDEREGKS